MAINVKTIIGVNPFRWRFLHLGRGPLMAINVKTIIGVNPFHWRFLHSG